MYLEIANSFLQLLLHLDEGRGRVPCVDVEGDRVHDVADGDLDDLGAGGERPDGGRGDHGASHRGRWWTAVGDGGWHTGMIQVRHGAICG